MGMAIRRLRLRHYRTSIDADLDITIDFFFVHILFDIVNVDVLCKQKKNKPSALFRIMLNLFFRGAKKHECSTATIVNTGTVDECALVIFVSFNMKKKRSYFACTTFCVHLHRNGTRRHTHTDTIKITKNSSQKHLPSTKMLSQIVLSSLLFCAWNRRNNV